MMNSQRNEARAVVGTADGLLNITRLKGAETCLMWILASLMGFA